MLDVAAFFDDEGAGSRATPLTEPMLRECRDCGHFQTVPAMLPGHIAHCTRCNAVLRRTRQDPLGRGLALYGTALVLLFICCTQTILTVGTFGMDRSATMLSGPLGFGHDGIWPLAAVVAFMTILAPLLRLMFTIYVLVGLRVPQAPVHLRLLFDWAERLRPWAMIEVFLLGVFVALTELPGQLHTNIGVTLYALIALMLVLVVADSVLDRHAVWEEMERRGIPDEPTDHAATVAAGPVPGAVSCRICGLVSLPYGAHRPHCPRCGSALESRKPNSVTRTWALLIGAAILYIPANTYPVLAFYEMWSGSGHTIIEGAEELLHAGLWPLALLVFLASIAVPCLKIAGLTTLLITTQRRSTWQLRQRTMLYRIVNTIGRWSMIDIVMESVLVGLVQFGAIVTIGPGSGALAFCAVVVLTMLAAESFDPRLMWDAALDRNDPANT